MTGLTAAALPAVCVGQTAEFLLIRRGEPVQLIHVVEINEHALVQGDQSGGWQTIALEQCVALLNSDVLPRARRNDGLLLLTDGQRFPGRNLVDSRQAPTRSDKTQRSIGEFRRFS